MERWLSDGMDKQRYFSPRHVVLTAFLTWFVAAALYAIVFEY